VRVGVQGNRAAGPKTWKWQSVAPAGTAKPGARGIGSAA